MKYGVIHYNTPGANLEEFLAWAHESGFDCCELPVGDFWPAEEENPEKRAESVRALLKKYQLEGSMISAGNDFCVLDPEAVEFQVNRMKRIAGIATIAGIRILRTEGGSPKDAVPQEKWKEAIIGCLKRCIPFLEELKITLAIDNHGVITNDGDLLYSILTEVKHPLIGTNLDTMNYRWYGNSIEKCDEIYRKVAKFVKHTHLKDGTGSRGEYRGAALGEGEIHLDYAVKVLKEAGYKGPWVAEYEGPEKGPEGIGYRKCLAWMKKNI